MRNTPEIRFKGFSDAWVQRKLGETAPLRGGFAFQSENFCGEGVPVIRISNILATGDVGGQFVFYQEQPKDENYTLLDKAALIAMSGATTGKVSILNNPRNTKFYQNQRVGHFIRSGNTDYGFISALVRSEFFLNRLQSVLVAGAQPNVSSKEIDELVFGFPARLPEQTAIGNFFHTLDNAITLLKRKADALKQLKKAYLQQMFPQAGERMPKVRFTGFTGPWRIRKLGEVIERVQGNDGRMDLPTLTISAASGWLDQRERFSNNIAGKEQENYTLLSKGELSYNKGNSKLAKYGVVFELKTHEEALVPRVYHSFRATKESNAALLEYMFATNIPDSELAKLITSGARMDGLLNIGFEAFAGISMNIPDKDEQDAISSFLRALDSQIIAQSHKLEQIKHLKSAYLQRMFV